VLARVHHAPQWRMASTIGAACKMREILNEGCGTQKWAWDVLRMAAYLQKCALPFEEIKRIISAGLFRSTER
jgi:hypothetical protein